MENRLNLLGRKITIYGEIHTIYAVTKTGVFAHIGEEKILDEDGDIAFPVYITSIDIDVYLNEEKLNRKQQLEKSISEITSAISIVVNVGGMCYLKATQITNTLSDERSKMRKELKEIQLQERKESRVAK